jgi:hypothetical protein
MAGRHASTSDFRAADTIKLTAVFVLPLVFLALLAFGAFLLTQARITQNAVVWAYAGDVLVFGTLFVVQIVRARRTRSRFPWLAACSLALWSAALVNVGIPHLWAHLIAYTVLALAEGYLICAALRWWRRR